MKKSFSKISLFTCLVMISVSALMPLKAFAVDANFYAANDILFYNPDDCSSNSGGGSADTGSDTATASANLELILNFLTGKGLSLAAASGIAGNMKHESGYDPTKIQGGAAASDNYTPVDGVGFGLVQWTNGGGQKGLVRQAASEGKKITDISVQLDYLWKSMNNKGYSAMMKRLNAIKSTSTYGPASAPMASAILFHGRTNAIMGDSTIASVNPPRGYEASGDSAAKVISRGTDAEKVYNKYKDTVKDGAGVAGVPAPDTSANTSISNCSGGSSSSAGQYGWDLTGANAMVFYNQCDSQWNSVKFAGGDLCQHGCGPTSLAMIVATLTGDKSVTPAVMAPWYDSHGGSTGGESTWNWSVIEQKWTTLKVTSLGTDMTKAKDVLKGGGLVIFSWTGAPFTGGGHIMVMRKYDPVKSKIYIASSGGRTNTEQSNEAWDESIFTNGYSGPAVPGRGSSGLLKGLWGIEKK